MAIEDAHKKADLLADNLGRRVGSIVGFSESGNVRGKFFNRSKGLYKWHCVRAPRRSA